MNNQTWTVESIKEQKPTIAIKRGERIYNGYLSGQEGTGWAGVKWVAGNGRIASGVFLWDNIVWALNNKKPLIS